MCLGYKLVKVLSQDPGVAVEQVGKTLKVTVDTTNSAGKSYQLSVAYDPKTPVVDFAPPALTQLTLGKPSPSLVTGEVVNILPVITLDDGSTLELAQAKVQAVSSNPQVATLNEQGVLTATGKGTTTVKLSVTWNGVTKAVDLAVKVGTLTNLPSRAAIADTYARDGATNEKTNYGKVEMVLNSGGVGYYRQAFVKFDISDLKPLAGSLGKVMLTVTGGIMNDAKYPDSKIVNVLALTNDWKEEELTWSTKPALGNRLGSVLVTKKVQGYDVDVTDYIREQIAAGATEVSFALDADKGDAYMNLTSKENDPSLAKAPTLKVSTLEY